MLSRVKYNWKEDSNHRLESKVEVKSEAFLPHPVAHLVTNLAAKTVFPVGFSLQLPSSGIASVARAM